MKELECIEIPTLNLIVAVVHDVFVLRGGGFSPSRSGSPFRSAVMNGFFLPFLFLFLLQLMKWAECTTE